MHEGAGNIPATEAGAAEIEPCRVPCREERLSRSLRNDRGIVKFVRGHRSAEKHVVDRSHAPVAEMPLAFGKARDERQKPEHLVTPAIRRDKPVAQVYAEYEQACARTLDLVTQIPADTLRRPGTLPWYGAEYSLDDLLVYMAYGHKREHVAQIFVFRDRLAG